MFLRRVRRSSRSIFFKYFTELISGAVPARLWRHDGHPCFFLYTNITISWSTPVSLPGSCREANAPTPRLTQKEAGIVPTFQYANISITRTAQETRFLRYLSASRRLRKLYSLHYCLPTTNCEANYHQLKLYSNSKGFKNDHVFGR